MSAYPFATLEPEFKKLPLASPTLRACVAIPARDEENGVVHTLDALVAQKNIAPFEWEILLFCNNCRDETAKIAREWAKNHPQIALHVVEKTLEGARACIGEARKIALDAAFLRLQNSRNPKPRVLLCTDADTRPEPFWLRANLLEIENGADAVGGRILLEKTVSDAARKIYLRDTTYRMLAARLESALCPDDFDHAPRHFQFFGASLALPPEIYAQIGGVPRVRCLEDLALERELERHDAKIRRSPHARVWTNARRSGRVECGLSTQLGEWDDLQNRVWLVPSGREIAWRARLKWRLKSLWRAPRFASARDFEELALALCLTPQKLEKAVGKREFFGEVWDELWRQNWDENPILRTRWPAIPVETATQELRAFLREVAPKM